MNALIQNLGKPGQDRKGLARLVITQPAGTPPPGERWRLFAGRHEVLVRLDARETQCLDVWRTSVAEIPPGATLIAPAQRRPVLDAELTLATRLRAEDPGLAIFDGRLSPDDLVRHLRGDIETLPYLDAPLVDSHGSPFSLVSAERVGLLVPLAQHTLCGVRENHGRWTYYTGAGDYLAEHGQADSRAEAVIMAQAHLWTAWLARVREIIAARGSLLWGEPVHAPRLDVSPVADPNAARGAVPRPVQWLGPCEHARRLLPGLLRTPIISSASPDAAPSKRSQDQDARNAPATLSAPEAQTSDAAPLKKLSAKKLVALAKARASRTRPVLTVPAGYRSIEHLLSVVADKAGRKLGGQADLARYLHVATKTISKWLARENTPVQANIDAIAQWLRSP